MGHNFNGRSAQQQRHLAKRAQQVDANHFFNLLTDPRMLETVRHSCRNTGSASSLLR